MTARRRREAFAQIPRVLFRTPPACREIVIMIWTFFQETEILNGLGPGTLKRLELSGRDLNYVVGKTREDYSSRALLKALESFQVWASSQLAHSQVGAGWEIGWTKVGPGWSLTWAKYLEFNGTEVPKRGEREEKESERIDPSTSSLPSEPVRSVAGAPAPLVSEPPAERACLPGCELDAGHEPPCRTSEKRVHRGLEITESVPIEPPQRACLPGCDREPGHTPPCQHLQDSRSLDGSGFWDEEEMGFWVLLEPWPEPPATASQAAPPRSDGGEGAKGAQDSLGMLLPEPLVHDADGSVNATATLLEAFDKQGVEPQPANPRKRRAATPVPQSCARAAGELVLGISACGRNPQNTVGVYARAFAAWRNPPPPENLSLAIDWLYGQGRFEEGGNPTRTECKFAVWSARSLIAKWDNLWSAVEADLRAPADDDPFARAAAKRDAKASALTLERSSDDEHYRL